MGPIRAIIGIALVTTLGSSAQNIVEYRYWWDDDMSTLTNVPIAGAGTVTVNTVLPTSLLGRGHHFVTVQFRDDNDHWGVPYTQLFQEQLQLAAWEYWFDDDIADRVTFNTPLTPEQDIT
ncbi:MAG: hypothetical protein KDB88_13590, partial [Flavobacteriales bacterium]|nr:hypothetical protein [Flavobacteriales bacterium]